MQPTHGKFIALPLILTLFDSVTVSKANFGAPDHFACWEVSGKLWDVMSSVPERKRWCTCKMQQSNESSVIGGKPTDPDKNSMYYLY